MAGDPFSRMMPDKGFTLIELISVMVILGIIGAIGSGFIVTAIDNYTVAEKRAKLLSKGRLGIEQISRQLRLAVPNTLRVSSSGNCIEFFPIVGGANYLAMMPDSANSAGEISSINTSPFNLGLGSAQHAIIAPFSGADVYTTAKPAARVSIASLSGTPYTTVNLSVSHRFARNSIRRRLFIADNPKRFCVFGENLVEFSGYGLDVNVLTDANPGGAIQLIALDVAAGASAFSLSPGSEDRNTAINMSLQFSDRGEQITLNNTVLVRNVP